MSRLVRKIRVRYSKSFESARADIGYFYHRQRRRARIIKKYKNWARKYLKTPYFPRPWYGKNAMERVKNLESKSIIRRRRPSTHAKQSRKYLRMRYHFCNTKPRSFYRTVYKAVIAGKQRPGPVNHLAYMLEGRLDSVLYRANFIRTKRFMRQFLRCKNASVDGNVTGSPSYPVKLEQIVTMINSPRDFQYRVMSRYGILVKRSKLAKWRKKLVRYIKRYRKKTRKTYKKKHFLFLFKGVFDKNWIYRKKVVLQKLRMLEFYIQKFKTKKIKSIKAKLVIKEKSKKKLHGFRAKFRRMVKDLQNLMRIKRLMRIVRLSVYRKYTFKQGIIFTRSVLKRLNRRILFTKRLKKKRYFVIAFHQFKRMRLKRAEASRYLFNFRKSGVQRRNCVFAKKFLLPLALSYFYYDKPFKLKKQLPTFKKTILKKVKLFSKISDESYSNAMCKSRKFVFKSAYEVGCSYKSLLKKLRIFRTRRLAYLRNLCLLKYYLLLIKNTAVNFCNYEKSYKSSVYKHLMYLTFFVCLKEKSENIALKKIKSKAKNLINFCSSMGECQIADLLIEVRILLELVTVLFAMCKLKLY